MCSLLLSTACHQVTANENFMKQSTKTTGIVFVASLILSTSCPALNASVSYPSLSMHGNTYQNACAPDQLARLQNALSQTSVRESRAAWVAVKTLLCADNKGAARLAVKSLLAPNVRRVFEATGDSPRSELVARTDALVDEMFAERNAWDASVEIANGKLSLQYFSNEACVRSRTLTFSKKQWSISEIGEACD